MLLRLVLLVLTFLGVVYGACPDKVKLNASVASCKQVCDKVGEKLDGGGITLFSAIGAGSNLAGFDNVSHLPTQCVCVFEKESDLGIPLETFSCAYQVVISSSGGSSLKLNVDVDIPEDLPTKLVKVMSFQAQDPGLSSGASILFAGLYAAYANAVKGIVAASALFVVMVVGSFYVVASISERMFDFLRDRVKVLSKDAGTEIARKFAYTTLAVVFFSLPIPANSPALKLNKAREGDSRKIAQECKKSFERLGGSPPLPVPPDQERRNVVEDEQRRYREHATRRCEELANLVGESRVYLPLAVGVVSAMVNTGTKFANQVKGITEGVVVAYMHYKIASAYKNLEILYKNDDADRIKEDIEEEAKSKSKPIDTKGCVEGEDVCSVFAKMTFKERNDKVLRNSACSEVFKTLEVVCRGGFGSATGIARSIEESAGEESAGNSGREQAFNTVMDSMTEIKKGLGWMSPAVLPISLVLFQTALLIPPDNPEDSAMATLVKSRGSWEELKEKTGNNEAVKAITDAIDDAEKVIGMVSWGDILHGKNRAQIAFNLGYIMGFVSVPPGSIFQSRLEKIFSAGGTTAAGIFTRITSLPAVKDIMDFLGKVFVAGAADVVATMIAFVIAHGVIDTIPLIAVAVPLTFKFLGYLFDVMKFVITLPFYAALVATKRYEAEALSFFGTSVKFMLTPPVFAIAPLVGFAGVELTIFFIYKVPAAIISTALGALSVNSVIVSFILGHTVAIMYIAANMAAVLVGWEAAKGFVDGVFEVLNRVVGFISSSANREISGAMSVLRARLAMG